MASACWHYYNQGGPETVLYHLAQEGIRWPTSLIKIYTALVRSVTEYTCQVWHTGLTSEQSNQLESIQRRVMYIIYPDLSYSDALETARLDTLQKRWETMCISFFRGLIKPNRKLHHLLPPPHEISYGLRDTGCLSVPRCRTNRFMNTLILYGLRHWNKATDQVYHFLQPQNPELLSSYPIFRTHLKLFRSTACAR